MKTYKNLLIVVCVLCLLGACTLLVSCYSDHPTYSSSGTRTERTLPKEEVDEAKVKAALEKGKEMDATRGKRYYDDVDDYYYYDYHYTDYDDVNGHSGPFEW